MGLLDLPDDVKQALGSLDMSMENQARSLDSLDVSLVRLVDAVEGIQRAVEHLAFPLLKSGAPG